MNAQVPVSAEMVIAVIAVVGLLGTLLVQAKQYGALQARLDRVEEDVCKVDADIEKLDAKFDNQVLYLMGRAKVVGLARGFIEENSPLKFIDASVRALYDPIADELHAFYKTKGKDMSETDMFMAINKLYGEWIIKEVCLAVDPAMSDGTCILLACEVAKESVVSCEDNHQPHDQEEHHHTN